MAASVVAEHETTTRIAHQPALDGLRGIAVLGVLWFHGGHLEGGYLGVDAFFVLSGFLITSLLLAESAGTASVSLRRFWARRARRLLPATVCVLAAVAVYAVALADTADLPGIRGDAFATLGYVANWHAIWASSNYFAIFTNPSPLQHTWSLAIEEQFYVLWPLVVLLLVRRRAAGDAARRVLRVSVVGALVSIALAQWRYLPTDPIQRTTPGFLRHLSDTILFGRGPSRVYYGTDTRAASILIGAALAAWCALRPMQHSTAPGRRRLLEASAVISMFGLAVAWGRLAGNATFLYRGGLTLCAVAVAVVIAAAVHPRRGPLYRVLSIAPLRAVGLVSYGLYLWHWPLFVVLTPERTHVDGWALFALRLAATAAVAYASYRIVEQPIRHGAGRADTWRVVVPVTGVVLSLALIAATIAPADPTVAETGPGGLVVVGDSVADSVVPGFTANRVFAADAAIPGCRLLPGEIRGADVHIDTCDWRPEWTRMVARRRPAVVLLLMGTWDLYDTKLPGQRRFSAPGSPEWDTAWTSGIDEVVRVVSAQGAKVLVSGLPCYGVLGDQKIPERSSFNVARVAHANSLLQRVVAQHPGTAGYADLFAHVCPEGRFQDELGTIAKQRRDGVHFSRAGATEVARWFLPQLRTLAPSARLGDERRTALVYGDTVVTEIGKQLEGQMSSDPRFSVRARGVPLGGLCDVEPYVRADIAKAPRAVVVLLVQANGSTPCVRADGPVGSDEALEKFRARLLALARDVARPGRTLLLVTPPPAPTASGRAFQARVRSIEIDIARAVPGVVVDDDPAGAVGGTTWVAALPCLPDQLQRKECNHGPLPVRGPDGVTLCHQRYTSLADIMDGCDGYANGIVLFADGVARSINAHG